MNTFSDRLKEVRTDLGFNQSDMARLIGVSVSTYHNWENEVSRPKTVDMMRHIAEEIGVTERWLSSGLGEKSAKAHAEAQAEAQADKKMETVYITNIKDIKQLEHIELLIKHLRELNLTYEEKTAIHATLCEIRTELEKRVIFGVRR